MSLAGGTRGCPSNSLTGYSRGRPSTSHLRCTKEASMSLIWWTSGGGSSTSLAGGTRGGPSTSQTREENS